MFDFSTSARTTHPHAMSDAAPLDPDVGSKRARQVRRTCLVVDASCDLPLAAQQHPAVRMLPVKVHVGSKVTVDHRDRNAFAGFYRNALTSPSANAGHSEPLTTAEMVDAFNREIAPDFDDGLGVFVASTRSAIYDRAKRACAQLRIDSFAQRLRSGRSDPMMIDCVDSGAFFSGYAAQVLDLIDLMDAGADVHELVRRQHVSAAHTYAYMAPGNVAYILERATKKGEKSVSPLAGWAAKTLSITPLIRAHQGQTEPVARRFGVSRAQDGLFELATQLVREELLMSRHLCLSYSGELADVSELIAYRDLDTLCKRHHVSLHLEPMSLTGSINVGPGALVLGFIAPPHGHLLG